MYEEDSEVAAYVCLVLRAPAADRQSEQDAQARLAFIPSVHALFQGHSAHGHNASGQGGGNQKYIVLLFRHLHLYQFIELSSKRSWIMDAYRQITQSILAALSAGVK